MLTRGCRPVNFSWESSAAYCGKESKTSPADFSRWFSQGNVRPVGSLYVLRENFPWVIFRVPPLGWLMVLDVSWNFSPHIFSHADSMFLMACITFLCCLPVTTARSAGQKSSVSICVDLWETLGLGQGVAGAKLPLFVSVFNQLKFQPMYFLPCWLHVSMTYK